MLQPQQPPSVSVNSVLEIPIAIREYCESQNKRKWGNWLKNALEVAAVGVAVWLAFLNLGVLKEIRQQTPEIKNSAKAAGEAAKAASDSAKAADDANRLTEESIRGRLAIKNTRLENPLASGGRAAIVIETENTGHSVLIEKIGFRIGALDFDARWIDETHETIAGFWCS